MAVALRSVVPTRSDAWEFVRWFAEAWMGRPVDPKDGFTAEQLAVVEADTDRLPQLPHRRRLPATAGVGLLARHGRPGGSRRLNRGDDRQADSALCTIVLARLRWETRSRTYVERRIAEGKTRREAIRCPKRHVARELYTIIIRAHTMFQEQALAA
ncbi:hypothetical protein ACFT8P_13405 [Streptomyces sp. NPDC057101]|uniref:hypothetical protein n=1 Tax=Streptomyces sp. NPDC057101 TaxID=3346020 RepID=UPI003627FB3E